MLEFIFTDFTWVMAGILIGAFVVFKYPSTIRIGFRHANLYAMALLVFLALKVSFNDWIDAFIERSGLFWASAVYFVMNLGASFFLTLLGSHFVWEIFLKEKEKEEPEPDVEPEPVVEQKEVVDHEAELEEILKSRK